MQTRSQKRLNTGLLCVCNVCGAAVLCRAVFASHRRPDVNANYVDVFPDGTAGSLCQSCENICRSDAGLKKHMRVQEEQNSLSRPLEFFRVSHVSKIIQRVRLVCTGPWPLSSTDKRWPSSIRKCKLRIRVFVSVLCE